MARIIAKRTGLPLNLVRQVLDAQCDVIRGLLRNGSEVHFRGLLKLKTFVRRVPPRPGSGPLAEGRTEARLRAWPMPALREEMRRWTSTESGPTTSR